MNVTELALRFIAGGSLVALVSIFAKAKNPLWAGLVMLFPMVTLVGLFFAGHVTEAAGLRRITLFSMAALPATLAFLVSFYLLIGRVGLVQSLVLSTAAWCAIAGIAAAAVRLFS